MLFSKASGLFLSKKTEISRGSKNARDSKYSIKYDDKNFSIFLPGSFSDLFTKDILPESSSLAGTTSGAALADVFNEHPKIRSDADIIIEKSAIRVLI